MDIDDAPLEGAQELAFQHPHEPGQRDQIHPGRLQRAAI